MVNENIYGDKTLFQSSNVLIIGNGFDLDLGLKTSYSDFYESNHWPFKNPSSRMGKFLQQERKHAKKWMDLEAKLGDYAFSGRNGMGRNGAILPYRLENIKEDNLADYELMTKRLCDYLREAENGDIQPNSTAASVLKGNLSSVAIPHIFSFNYTNLNQIAEKLGIQMEFDYEHIHGSLANNNIILGVGENYSDNANKHLPRSMDFLYKTSSPNYSPPQMAEILNNAKRITFFGLSLGGMDSPYFSGLFQNLSSQAGKIITFFTYDNESRLQLLRHLRSVEAINLNDVCTRHSLTFICTSCPNDKPKLEKYLQDLKESFNPIF